MPDAAHPESRLPQALHGRGLARRPWLALLFVASVAATFALGSTLVRFAFRGGAGTLTVVTTRTTIAMLGIGLVLAARRVPLRLVGHERWAAPLLGVLLAGYSFAYYRGLTYMPVALTTVTFYTYPLMTGLFGWVAGQERFGWRGAAALPLAFAGLLLALDITSGGFNLPGAGWALLGALGFGCFLLLSARLFARGGDTRPRNFAILGAASATFLLAMLATGRIEFPHTPLGWSGMIASSLCYTLAINGVMIATALLGAARVAVVMNVEPVASLILTFLILGERLGPLQVLGAGLVVAAIFMFRARVPAEEAAHG